MAASFGLHKKTWSALLIFEVFLLVLLLYPPQGPTRSSRVLGLVAGGTFIMPAARHAQVGLSFNMPDITTGNDASKRCGKGQQAVFFPVSLCTRGRETHAWLTAQPYLQHPRQTCPARGQYPPLAFYWLLLMSWRHLAPLWVPVPVLDKNCVTRTIRSLINLHGSTEDSYGPYKLQGCTPSKQVTKDDDEHFQEPMQREKCAKIMQKQAITGDKRMPFPAST